LIYETPLLVQMSHMTIYTSIQAIFPNFRNCMCCKKYLKDNKHNSQQKNMLGYLSTDHYLFLKPHSFPRATLSKNCSFLGTDNVQGQISKNISAPNDRRLLFIYTMSYKIWWSCTKCLGAFYLCFILISKFSWNMLFKYIHVHQVVWVLYLIIYSAWIENLHENQLLLWLPL